MVHAAQPDSANQQLKQAYVLTIIVCQNHALCDYIFHVHHPFSIPDVLPLSYYGRLLSTTNSTLAIAKLSQLSTT